jgi:hypothetical protein
MLVRRISWCAHVLAVVGGALAVAPVHVSAAQFTTSYTDGGSWNTVYAQGFSPSLSPSPAPGSAGGDTVYLDQFQFFKSGNADTAANFQLAIINEMFANLSGLSTSSPAFVGLSTNTIASSAPVATGGAITFDFDNLPLIYGEDYAAVFVNVGLDGSLTPVRVSALTANYTENPPGSGTFRPQTNYGTESQFDFATSNFINTDQFGSFFSTFSFAGDANFVATLNTVVPEPGCVALGALAVLTFARRRRR